MKKNTLWLLILLGLFASTAHAAKPEDCVAKLKQLIVTCPNFKNPFRKELSARVDKQEGTIYTIVLFVKSSGENQESPVGSIVLNTKANTLIDTTYDSEDGVVLQYNKALYDGYLSGCLKIVDGS